jgi:tetratricopeptide (TPR) repeat protein
VLSDALGTIVTMKHIGLAIERAMTGASVPALRERPRLPAASQLAPQDATDLGSQLLAGGAFAEAFPYLLLGVQGRPSAFAWCRLGKLCRDAGQPEHAVRAYDEALALEPGNRFALVGRAAALAECFDASVPALVDAFTSLVELLRAGGDRSPVAWTAYSLMRAVCRQRPEPALLRCAEVLKSIAQELDGRSGPARQHDLERRLDAVLRVQELLAHARTERDGGLAATDERQELAGPHAAPQLPAGSRLPS